MFTIGTGCCESTAPFLYEDFWPGPDAEPVGEVAGVAVYAPAYLRALYPADDGVVIDVDDGLMAESMSIETEYGCRFVLRGDERVAFERPTEPACDVPEAVSALRPRGAQEPSRRLCVARVCVNAASSGTRTCRTRRAARRRGRRSRRRPRFEVARVRRREHPVARMRSEQPRPFRARVRRLPRDLALDDRLELAALRRAAYEEHVRLPVLADGVAEQSASRAYLVVVGLERLRVRAPDVPEHRERAAGLQCFGDLLVAIGAVHPVPRLRGEHQTERTRANRPLLERRLLHVDALGAQDARHLRARLQRVHREAAIDETHRRLAGARADLERGVTRVQSAVLDDGVEERVGVRRAGGVVLLGDLAEHEGLLAPGFAGRQRDQAGSDAGASLFTRSNMRAVQPAISTGGRSSSTIRRATSVSASAAGSSGWASTTGFPTSPPSDTAPSIGTSPTSGAPVSAARPPAAAGSEDRVARTVGRDERVHVLHDAEHLQVRAARHVGDARRDLLRALRGRGDHEHLGLRQQARERHLDVTGAGRHVDEQVVEVAPADVDEELLERLGEDQAAPHERGVLVVDEQSHAHDLEQTVADLHLQREDLAGAVGHLRAREAGLHAEHARDREAPDVGVEHADGEAARRERGGQVRGDRRLPDPALAAPHGDHAGGGRDLGRRRELRRLQARAASRSSALPGSSRRTRP